MSDDDEAMVHEAAGLLPDIIERLRREDPNHPIVKNMDDRTVTYELRHRRDRGRPVYVAPDFNPATLRAEAPLDQMRAESERLSPDATPTGVGDPLAGVLRSIDELLEGQ